MSIPAFTIGEHVKIIPLEDMPARVISVELDRDGWTITVRYFHEGKAETLKLFEDEAVRA